MEPLSTAINSQSPEFLANFAAHRALAAELRGRLQVVRQGGEPRRQTEQGKLCVRERIDHLLDPGSPFLEFSPLAAFELYEQPVPAGGLVTGIGRVADREVLVIANDATVASGKYFPITVQKFLRAQQIAGENHLPCLQLLDSSGVFLPAQAEISQHFGQILHNQAQMRARGIPQITAVMGHCTGPGACLPALSDEVVLVKSTGIVTLGSPELVNSLTGERLSPDELGGAEVHTRQSGLADHVAEDDEQAVEILREIVGTLPLKVGSGKSSFHFPLSRPAEPLYPAAEIYGILPTTSRENYDVREIIARLVDGSQFREFKARYSPTLVTGFARIHGYPVGILANNSLLFRESALKGVQFIELCQQREIPLLFLQNITGFMIGKEHEAGGIIRDGTKLIQAVATARVPKLTVIIGGSCGAGSYAMCGRALNPRFLWVWPNARFGWLGAEQAANVLLSVRQDQRTREGQPPMTEAEIAAFQRPILEKYETEGSPYHSTARLWDDGIIDPVDTRQILGLALSVVLNVPEKQGILESLGRK